MKIHHADHGIEAAVIEALVKELNPGGFFISTVRLPNDAPDALCALHGPHMGDGPVLDCEVVMKQRSPDRPMSRMVARKPRKTREVTIIGMAAPDAELEIYTCFGGPAAPREPGDSSLTSTLELEESATFWAQHALSL